MRDLKGKVLDCLASVTERFYTFEPGKQGKIKTENPLLELII